MAGKIKALKEIVNKDPKNLSAWVELGNLYFDSNQPKEAIDAFHRANALASPSLPTLSMYDCLRPPSSSARPGSCRPA
jgi:cytochrome c-type biogenesis protein CcmH/NrfG